MGEIVSDKVCILGKLFYIFYLGSSLVIVLGGWLF